MSYTVKKSETKKRKPIVVGVIRGLLTACGLRPLPRKFPPGTYMAIDQLGRKEMRIPARNTIDWLA